MNKNNIYIYLASDFLAVTSFTATAVAQEQPKDSLAHYVNVAIENNPAIKSQHLAYQAFEQKIDQAGAFQDPELSLGFYTKPMDIVGGRQVGDITLMQMLPWFGTRKSARQEASHMAQMQYQEYLEGKEATVLQVYTQWYILQKLEQQLENAKQNKSLLEQLEQLSLKRFSAPTSAGTTSSASMNTTAAVPTTSQGTSNSMGAMSMGGSSNASGATAKATTTSNSTMSSGGGMSSMGGGSSSGMSDVLRIRLEVIEIENTIESLLSQIKAEKVKFNALLNREANSEVVVDKNIEKVDFLMNEDDVLHNIEDNNPMLGMITEQSLAYKAKSEMDKKMSYPMIGLGVQYMIIGKTNDPMLAMGSMNGNDMIMPMVTITLPVFRKKYNSQQEEGKLWWKSSDENLQNSLNTLKAEYYSFKSQLEDTERTITLYGKQSTLAETTFNLIVKEFVSGKSDLTNVIQVQRQLLDYQLKKAEAIANYNTMVASINKLMAVGSHSQNQ